MDVDWETGATIRVLIFVGVFMLIAVFGAAFAESSGAAESTAEPGAAAILMTFLVTHMMPVIIMLGACARMVPPGERGVAWQTDGLVPNMPGQAFLRALFLALAVTAIQFGWGSALEAVFNYAPDDPTSEILGKGNREVIAAIIFGAVILAPIAEEMFFRRVLHRALWRRLGETQADVITAAAFSLAHFSILSFPGLFFFGYVQQRILRRFGSLSLVILVHAIYNAIVVGWMVQNGAGSAAQ